MFKKMSRMAMHNELTEKINIYCNDVVYEAIKNVSKYVLSSSLMNAIYKITNFVVLKDGDTKTINEVTYEFFDILAKWTKQFGLNVV